MANGWIKLHRKILDCPIVMQDAEHLAVWIYLLANATHKDYSVVFGGEKMILKPGQFITGRKQIALHLSMNESKVYRILKHFENDQQIEIKSNNKASLITVINWALYQSDDEEVNTKRTAKRTTSEQQVNTKQEYKNDKNVNNIIPCVVDYLNQRCGSNYRATTEKTQKCIKARLGEGYTLDDFKVVIDKKVDSWLHNEKMSQYLRPETLFGTKFESYLNEKVVKESPVKKGNKFNEMIHTDYDFDALEKQLLGE